eukprot:1316090-Amorphochlora_amoeboformis.AAC.1
MEYFAVTEVLVHHRRTTEDLSRCVVRLPLSFAARVARAKRGGFGWEGGYDCYDYYNLFADCYLAIGRSSCVG